MERIKALIDKLYQQKEQGNTPAQLLATVQLLQSELLQFQQKNASLSTAKVAVTMPVNLNFAEEVSRRPLKEEITEGKIDFPQVKVPEYNPYQEPESKDLAQKQVAQPEYVLRRPLSDEHNSKEETPKPEFTQSSFYTALEATEQAPTLIQHQPKKEVHELIGDSKESLNDRLKQEKTEVAHVLKDTPIKDLRKGIGINDRFTFVNELFRGDEAMYERSIKTINSFGILSEAEYWINRELKFKLGWNDNKEEVQHFYHLVRRRFS
jgi:hypothetical protein